MCPSCHAVEQLNRSIINTMKQKQPVNCSNCSQSEVRFKVRAAPTSSMLHGCSCSQRGLMCGKLCRVNMPLACSRHCNQHTHQMLADCILWLPADSVPCVVWQVMLYDDEEGDCITPEDVWEVLEQDLASADAVVWLGISFEQSASTEYFRKVGRHRGQGPGLGKESVLPLWSAAMVCLCTLITASAEG